MFRNGLNDLKTFLNSLKFGSNKTKIENTAVKATS